MVISSFSGFQRQIILSQKTDRIPASALHIWAHSFLFCLRISSSLSLMHSSKVPLGFTTASLESCHALPFRVLPKTQFQKAFSLHAGALSVWHTHYLNRYMAQCGCHERSEQSRNSKGHIAWCGCHEILIALCYPKEVFYADQEKSQLNRNFLSDCWEKR